MVGATESRRQGGNIDARCSIVDRRKRIRYRSCAGESSNAVGPFVMPIADGMNVPDSRLHDYPPRWNAEPSQDLLVIRRNPQTGEVSLDPLRWGLIP